MLLYYSIAALHVIVCVILVLVVLLQSGKGADLAGAFGGGATQTAFGSRGPASFLSKMTTAAAIVFMLTSISLAMISTRTSMESKSILETTKGTTSQPEKKQSSSILPKVPTREQIQRAQEAAEAAKAKQQVAPVTAPAKNENPAAKPAESKPPSK
ncbi:MAG TPA: preprotein translocase subunit SecG [Acidobacteriota bacterium]|nr:preprotein translocase subunit SecG [Acidobacteriota bacterium]